MAKYIPHEPEISDSTTFSYNKHFDAVTIFNSLLFCFKVRETISIITIHSI